MGTPRWPCARSANRTQLPPGPRDNHHMNSSRQALASILAVERATAERAASALRRDAASATPGVAALLRGKAATQEERAARLSMQIAALYNGA